MTRLQTRLYDQFGHALNHDPAVLIQTQDLPPVYEENSCLYLFTRENLLKRNHRIGAHPFMFEIDADEAWDIDEELDFAVCEFLMSRKRALVGDIGMKKGSETWLAIGLITLVTLLTYGVLIPQLGFYRDDWYLFSTAQSQGSAGISGLVPDRSPLGRLSVCHRISTAWPVSAWPGSWSPC